MYLGSITSSRIFSAFKPQAVAFPRFGQNSDIKPRVYVIEDNPVALSIFKELLDQWGFDPQLLHPRTLSFVETPYETKRQNVPSVVLLDEELQVPGGQIYSGMGRYLSELHCYDFPHDINKIISITSLLPPHFSENTVEFKNKTDGSGSQLKYEMGGPIYDQINSLQNHFKFKQLLMFLAAFSCEENQNNAFLEKYFEQYDTWKKKIPELDAGTVFHKMGQERTLGKVGRDFERLKKTTLLIRDNKLKEIFGIPLTQSFNTDYDLYQFAENQLKALIQKSLTAQKSDFKMTEDTQ